MTSLGPLHVETVGGCCTEEGTNAWHRQERQKYSSTEQQKIISNAVTDTVGACS